MFPGDPDPFSREALMISRICDLEAPVRQGLERLAAGPGTAGPGQWRKRPSAEASRDDAEPGAQSAVA
jgi:hypothetical protein